MNIPRAAMARGGRMRAARARERLLKQIEGKTPQEIFRIGYLRGLQSKYRETARWKRSEEPAQ